MRRGYLIRGSVSQSRAVSQSVSQSVSQYQLVCFQGRVPVSQYVQPFKNG
jgi:hypothetical protein